MDSDFFAKQVKIDYEFMDTLHQQALALIKDVEGQLADEGIKCLRPGGYRFSTNPISTSLDQPQPAIADFYSIYFMRTDSEATTTNTPLDAHVPPIAFMRVTLRERNIKYPEVRFGVIRDIVKAKGREDAWPKKVEDLLSTFSSYAFNGRNWQNSKYADSYVSMNFTGISVPLAEIPDSEAIATKIIDPLLQNF